MNTCQQEQSSCGVAHVIGPDKRHSSLRDELTKIAAEVANLKRVTNLIAEDQIILPLDGTSLGSFLMLTFSVLT